MTNTSDYSMVLDQSGLRIFTLGAIKGVKHHRVPEKTNDMKML